MLGVPVGTPLVGAGDGEDGVLRARAPEAHIVLVQYLTVVPERPCAAAAVAQADAARARALALRLARATARAAERAGGSLRAWGRSGTLCAGTKFVSG